MDTAHSRKQPDTLPKDFEDNPEWTDEDFARAKPAAEVLPPEVIAAFGKKRGRPKAEAAKVAVKLRVAPDVLAAYKAAGAGWQTRMHEALRAGMNTAARKSNG